jgi:O-antigen/teichoic acid export membrane protein
VSNSLNNLSIAGKLKFLAKDAVFYGGLSALSRFSSLITFPFLTRFLSKETFAVLDLFLVIELLFIFLSIMGQDSALGRYFYDKEDLKSRKSVCTASLLIQGVFATFVIGGMLFFRHSIMAFYTVPIEYEPLIWILALKIFLTLPVNYSINLMKWSFTRKGFALLSLGSSIGIMISAVIGAYYFENPLRGILILQTCSSLIFGLLGLYLCRNWLGSINIKTSIPALLAFGMPYGFIVLSGNLIPSIDRSMISNFLGMEALAIYVVTNRVAGLFRIGAVAFQNAWGPFYMASYKTENAQKTFDLILRGYCLIVAIIFIVFSLIAEWFVPLLAGEQYAEASNLSVYLAFGIMVQGVGWITGIGSTIAKRPVFAMISYAIQLLATFSGIYFLLPIFGLIGAVAGVVIGYILQVISMTVMGYYCYPLRFTLFRPTFIILFSLLIVTTQQFSFQFFSPAGVYFYSFFSTVFMIFICVNSKERKQVLSLFWK